MKEIAFVIHDGVQALDLVGPMDVLAEANGFVPGSYRCVVVVETTASLTASNGMTLTAHLSFEEAARPFHTVLVTGGPALPDRPADMAMSEWLRSWGTKAKRYGSICTGTFLLGHAGLLDRRTVTTHWQSAARLSTLFPSAHVEPDRIFHRDGALVTSAGVTAGIDLALALVSEDHGPAVSLSCAKRLNVVMQRQGGQSQFSPLLLPPCAPETPLGKVQAFVMANRGESLPVERLAAIAGVSKRSIARLFVANLGITPHDFVEEVRVDHARNLLEATDLALKCIAFDCGFGSAEQMRGVFQRRLGVSPRHYRASFRPNSTVGTWR